MWVGISKDKDDKFVVYVSVERLPYYIYVPMVKFLRDTLKFYVHPPVAERIFTDEYEAQDVAEYVKRIMENLKEFTDQLQREYPYLPTPNVKSVGGKYSLFSIGDIQFVADPSKPVTEAIDFAVRDTLIRYNNITWFTVTDWTEIVRYTNPIPDSIFIRVEKQVRWKDERYYELTVSVFAKASQPVKATLEYTDSVEFDHIPTLTELTNSLETALDRLIEFIDTYGG